jgi:iron(III) transport system ATP-binding protein/putative spermidine/putrescine transport system ATP-binding protein
MIGGQSIAGNMIDQGVGGQPAIIMLHPDQLKLRATEEEGNSNEIRGTVIQTIFEGIHWRVIIATEDHQRIHAFHAESLELGSACCVQCSPEQTMIYRGGAHTEDE